MSPNSSGPRSGKIYTRRGDQGGTSLLGDQSVQKDDLRVRTYGALDELQSQLGLARAVHREEVFRSIIYGIQKDLFVAGSELASAPESLGELAHRIGSRQVRELEARIDELSEEHGMPQGFVTPGDSLDSAALHVARSVCRRVERLIVALNRNSGEHTNVIVYFNRLSDLLFMLAWATQVRSATARVLDDLAARQT